MKYVLYTIEIDHRIGPIYGYIDGFKLECFNDSNWGGNSDNRKSKDGLFTYFISHYLGF